MYTLLSNHLNTLLLELHTVNPLTIVRINKRPLYDELELSILMTFWGVTTLLNDKIEHLSGVLYCGNKTMEVQKA